MTMMMDWREPLVFIYIYIHCESKKGTSILLPITLADVDGFSKFLHCWIHREICNKLTVTLPTTPSTCCYTTL